MSRSDTPRNSGALATSIAAGITTELTVASGPSRKMHFPSFITATFDDRVAGGNLIYIRLLSRKIFTSPMLWIAPGI